MCTRRSVNAEVKIPSFILFFPEFQSPLSSFFARSSRFLGGGGTALGVGKRLGTIFPEGAAQFSDTREPIRDETAADALG